MKTHRILGFFLIISLCFSSAYMCDDGQQFESQGADNAGGQGKPEGQQEEDGHKHHEGCGHDYDHDHDGHGHG